MTDDPLLYLLRSPAFVERTVRTALVEMIAIRREFGMACDVRSFVRLALVRSRSVRDASIDDADALSRHELEAAVVRAAACFASSPLGNRLRTMPLERIVGRPEGADLAVLDRHRNLHYVRLETYAGTEARLDAVARTVRAMANLHPAKPASLHLFSLRDGTLRSYPADVRRRATRRSERVRAA